jgi:hypothetical protein
MTLVVGAAAAMTAATVTVTLASGPRSGGSPARAPSLRARLIAAFGTARGDTLYARTSAARGGNVDLALVPAAWPAGTVRVLGLDVDGVPAKDGE